MADSKLTDLPALTLITDNDVFYVVNTNANTSNSINFGDIATSLITNNDSFSAGLVKQVDDNTIDIGEAQTDIIDLNLSATNLRTDLDALSTNFEISNETIPTTAVSFGSINLPSSYTIANDAIINSYLNIPQLSSGDSFQLIPTAVGGLSGVFTNSFSLSDKGDGTGDVQIVFFNTTGSSVNIPSTLEFKYIAERILF
tara:strand:+ start:783 stop:1379 length:597 start_codon:yes stop_codon:yes gene_type:complete